MTAGLLPPNGSARGASSATAERLTLVVGLAIVLALIRSQPARLLPPEFGLYVLQPLLWLGLAAAATVSGPRIPRVRRRIVAVAILLGTFQVSVALGSGLVFGFSLSPYSQSLPTLLLNLLYLVSHLIGLELTRWKLLSDTRTGASGARCLPRLAAVWLIFWIACLPPGVFSGLSEPGSAFRLAGRILLPGASEGLLATYLAWSAGPVPALAYRAVVLAFEWGSPVLPNPAWPVTAFLGTVAPLLALIAVSGTATPWRQPHPVTTVAPRLSWASGLLTPGWLAVALVGIFLFWFNTGMLGFRPSLVSGSSMRPAIQPGDIVITRSVRPEQIQVGDVIRFRLGPSWVLHRVVEVRQQSGHTIFITRGDNNQALDPPVEPSQLEGRLVLLLPRAGKLAIEVNRLLRPSR